MLSEGEKNFIKQFRGDANRHGFAILLKSLYYLGYFPEQFSEVPLAVRLFIAKQLNNLPQDFTDQYLWNSSTRRYHFTLIRHYTGYQFSTAQDKEDLETWLRQQGAYESYTEEDLFECALERLRLLRIELPAEKELRRIVNSALNSFFQDIEYRITEGLTSTSREKLNKLLITPGGEILVLP